MDEPALEFEGVTLSPQKEIVRRFYKDLWDHADKSLIRDIFHPGFTFRGSLGPTLVGHEQFASYVDWVTSGVDLTFAIPLAADWQSECQIRNSTSNLFLLVVL